VVQSIRFPSQLPAQQRGGRAESFGEELEIKEVLMKAREMKSSKHKKKTRRDSSWGIHLSLLISAAARLLFRRSRKRVSQVKRVVFSSVL